MQELAFQELSDAHAALRDELQALRGCAASQEGDGSHRWRGEYLESRRALEDIAVAHEQLQDEHAGCLQKLEELQDMGEFRQELQKAFDECRRKLADREDLNEAHAKLRSEYQECVSKLRESEAAEAGGEAGARLAEARLEAARAADEAGGLRLRLAAAEQSLAATAARPQAAAAAEAAAAEPSSCTMREELREARAEAAAAEGLRRRLPRTEAEPSAAAGGRQEEGQYLSPSASPSAATAATEDSSMAPAASLARDPYETASEASSSSRVALAAAAGESTAVASSSRLSTAAAAAVAAPLRRRSSAALWADDGRERQAAKEQRATVKRLTRQLSGVGLPAAGAELNDGSGSDNEKGDASSEDEDASAERAFASMLDVRSSLRETFQSVMSVMSSRVSEQEAAAEEARRSVEAAEATAATAASAAVAAAAAAADGVLRSPAAGRADEVARLRLQLAEMAQELSRRRSSDPGAEPSSGDRPGASRIALQFVSTLGAAVHHPQSPWGATAVPCQPGQDEDGSPSTLGRLGGALQEALKQKGDHLAETSPLREQPTRGESPSRQQPSRETSPTRWSSLQQLMRQQSSEPQPMREAASVGAQPRGAMMHRGFIQKRPVSSMFGRRQRRFLVLWDHAVEWFPDENNLDAPAGSMELSRDTELKVSGKVISLSTKSRSLVFQPDACPPDGGSPTSRSSEVEALRGWIAALNGRLDALFGGQRGNARPRAQSVFVLGLGDSLSDGHR